MSIEWGREREREGGRERRREGGREGEKKEGRKREDIGNIKSTKYFFQM